MCKDAEKIVFVKIQIKYKNEEKSPEKQVKK